MNESSELNWYEDIRDIRDVRELINGSAELYSGNPAFWIKKYKGGDYKPLSYAMVKHDMDALGTRLTDMGYRGRRIAVMGQGCYEWFITYLAVINGVGVIVPIDKEFDAAQVENILQSAECDTLFYTSDIEKKIDSVRGLKLKVKMDFYGDRTERSESFTYPDLKDAGCVHWRKLVHEGIDLLALGNRSYLEADIDRDAMAVLLFTSGTTGQPKGVMLSHHNLAFDVMEIARLEHIRQDDLTLSVLPIHHTYESSGTLLFLYRGASLAYSEGLKYISKNMLEVHNTFFIAVPLLLEMIYDRIWKTAKKQGKDKLLRRAIALNNKSRAIGIDMGPQLFKSIKKQLGGRLRMVVSGAAAVPPELIRGFDELGIDIVSGYGLTETSPMIAATPAFDKRRIKKAGSTGICVRNGEIRIADRDENGIGEIQYRGENVMLGYYNMPELTAETIEDGWFKTGDLGFMDPDGWLYITGRKKNVIVTATGENIYPEEIEEVINANPLVADSMVYALQSENTEKVAVQILPDYEYIKEEKGITDYSEIKSMMTRYISEVNDHLPTYKVIREVLVRRTDFLRTTTRKIKRQDNIRQTPEEM